MYGNIIWLCYIDGRQRDFSEGGWGGGRETHNAVKIFLLTSPGVPGAGLFGVVRGH